MSVLFSRQCEYALQAILYLAAQPPENLIPIRTVAEKLDIPYHFVSKTLQQLAKAGFIHSQRGKQGGFSISDISPKVTLYDIVVTIDGEAFANDCILGFKDCDSKAPCLLHDTWSRQRESITRILQRATIKHLTQQYKKTPLLKRKLGLK